MNLKQIFGNTLKISLPLLLGIALLWYLYHKSNIGEIVTIIKTRVDYKILFSSLIFGLGANIIRAFRWAMLIDSLGKPVGKMNVIYAILGNYAINVAVPFRAGDIWRCGVTNRYEKVPFAKLLGTLFVDRFSDTLMVAILTLSLFLFNISFFNQFFSENPPLVVNTLYNIFSSVWTGVGLLAVIVLIRILFTKFKHLIVIQKAKVLIFNVWEGIRSILKIKRRSLFLLQTLLIWSGYFLYFYISFYAFGFTKDLGIRIGLIAFVMSSLGVAVPVQGGIGVWHFMVISTLVTFGVNKTDAGAFAFVVFAVQSMWVILTGLFGIIALPLINKKCESANTLNIQNKTK
ncbi:MAG: flippase-like domain-containing protein [Tannerella sp.]|nr:flippase-like domain-containing protein [Tannerella sp.]